MTSFTLDPFPVHFDLEQLQKSLRIKEGSGWVKNLRRLAEEAQAVGKPKAFYKIAFIGSKTDEQVVIDGVKLTSRVLRVNLDSVHRVFPYVVTCGLELEDWSNSKSDFLEKYWADVIKEKALHAAVQNLHQHLTERYNLGKISRMNPGSLADWPLEEQRPLFAILGEGPGSIGIRLTDHFLMFPVKSVSGIFFPTEISFESCQLCPREGCSGRRAPYDRELFNQKYHKNSV